MHLSEKHLCHLLYPEAVALNTQQDSKTLTRTQVALSCMCYNKPQAIQIKLIITLDNT